MPNDTTTPRKKKYLTNAIMAIFILVVLGLVFWNLPRGYSPDLTQIGKGKNIVVLVHDHFSVDSGRLMDNLSTLRTDYAGVIEFVVADMNVAEGQLFAKSHNATAATLLFFAPDGAPLGSMQGAQTIETIKNTLDRVYRLPPHGGSGGP